MGAPIGAGAGVIASRPREAVAGKGPIDQHGNDQQDQQEQQIQLRPVATVGRRAANECFTRRPLVWMPAEEAQLRPATFAALSWGRSGSAHRTGPHPGARLLVANPRADAGMVEGVPTSQVLLHHVLLAIHRGKADGARLFFWSFPELDIVVPCRARWWRAHTHRCRLRCHHCYTCIGPRTLCQPAVSRCYLSARLRTCRLRHDCCPPCFSSKAPATAHDAPGCGFCFTCRACGSLACTACAPCASAVRRDQPQAVESSTQCILHSVQAHTTTY